MVGAETEEIFLKSKEILKYMGKNITYCGNTGNGQVAKICNNVILHFFENNCTLDASRDINDCCIRNYEFGC
jgi:3-hydroxyisobutyrate dehydrogenase-like beta-hydroxyacid dehydrogenase